MVRVFIGLGSNIGEREKYLETALTQLREHPAIKIFKISKNYETEPEGYITQPRFINAVAELETPLPPEILLEELQEIEKKVGRTKSVKWGPREIDLDILVYGDQEFCSEKLQLPHPLIAERVFVLEPLTEIAPEIIHPVHKKSFKELLNILQEK